MDQYKAHTNLNAVTYIDEAKLAEDARAIDRSRAQGAQLALAGLPIIIKDNINTAGFPTTAGTPFLKNYRPKANAPLADMLFKQGAILFAKSNMHELALGSTSANPTFGYVKIPHSGRIEPRRPPPHELCGNVTTFAKRRSTPRNILRRRQHAAGGGAHLLFAAMLRRREYSRLRHCR